MRMFSGLELAVDLIYDPYRTKFLQDARRLTGCHIKSGVEMLIFRAVASRNIWLGKPDETDQDKRFITPIKRRLLQEQLNVIAVGMPGSGKTTIMRRYAYELGLKFIDTDEETEKLMGEKIADVLTEPGLGEDYFKAMEHLAVKEACKSRGAVIATGGSTALNPLNRDLLRANGIVVYVRRPLDKLDKRGRQISINKGLAEFFNARDRIYRRTADMSILNSRIFGERRAKTGEGNTYNYELKGFVYYIARKIERYLNEIADNKWT
jgi:shikimate dehydrogenase